MSLVKTIRMFSSIRAIRMFGKKTFIDKYHGDGKYLFWPDLDLAGVHYATRVLFWLDDYVN